MEKLPFIFHNSLSPSRGSTVLNWHKNIEIIYCTAGCGIAQIDSLKFNFKKNDIIIVNPNEIHSFSSVGSVTYQCLIIDNDFCIENGLDAQKMKFSSFINDNVLEALFIAVAREINAYRENMTSIRAARIRREILSFLIELCENHAVPNEARTHYSGKRVKKIISHIQENLSQPLSLEAIARSVNISKYHLCREFKELTGITIFSFINNARCAEAQSLITKGSSVSEAAFAVGFENLSYFARKFKETMGYLPSECIKKSKAEKP